MNISAEEKLMYKVMKALYESGISVSFKGSILQYTMAKGQITSTDVVLLTKKSRVTAQRTLKNLVKKSFLVWHGTSKNDPTQYYTLE